MFRKVALTVRILVILSILLGLYTSPLSARQSTPAPSDLGAPPNVAPPDPLESVRAYLPDDPQTQALDGALAGLPGYGWPEAALGASPVGLDSPAAPSRPLAAGPQLPLATVALPDSLSPTAPEPERPQVADATAALAASDQAAADQPEDAETLFTDPFADDPSLAPGDDAVPQSAAPDIVASDDEPAADRQGSTPILPLASYGATRGLWATTPTTRTYTIYLPVVSSNW